MVPVAVSIEPRLSFAVESAPEMTDFAARVYDPSQLNSSSCHNSGSVAGEQTVPAKVLPNIFHTFPNR